MEQEKVTFTQVSHRLDLAGKVFCKPGTERVRALCEKLGHPEKDLAVIHVTGTNGKGSTCALLESVLRTAGYRTGFFTTPYLTSRCDSIRLCGAPVSEAAFAKIASEVLAAADGMTDPPTEFELLTVCAFLTFARAAVDVVLLEVCMGGRLDATNVIDAPLLSVITGVSIEHTAFLGSTLREIAAVKAGIVKEGCPILYGGEENEAEEVIRAEANALHAPFYKVAKGDVRDVRTSLLGTRFSFGKYNELSLSLLGLYQVKNAACALSALSLLSERLPHTEADVRRAFASLRWEARFERLSDDPPLFFDGAHNPEGIAAAKETLTAYFKDGVVLVGGILADKDYTQVASLLAPHVRHAFTVTPPSPRALPAEKYAEALEAAGIDAQAAESIPEALAKAKSYAKAHGLPVVVLGSLYLYDSIKKA